MDPTVVRLLWVLVTLFTGGAAFWLYLALWLFLPVGDNTRGQVAEPAVKLSERSLGVIAWALIGLGVLWILANFGILPVLWRSLRGVFHVVGLVFWPLVLLAIGWLILSKLGHTQAISQKVKHSVPEADSLKEGVRSGYRTVRERTPLKRSKEDRILLGVCAGIAHWLGIEPMVVRILWVLLTIAFLGTGVLLYIILAIIMPEDDGDGVIETVEGEVLDPVTPSSQED
ncbi:MAG TPA: PspC domain-containing protein [Anaerolineae bacterium]|nr:PspC domain-containing protein [Anaerolineae bacterium]